MTPRDRLWEDQARDDDEARLREQDRLAEQEEEYKQSLPRETRNRRRALGKGPSPFAGPEFEQAEQQAQLDDDATLWVEGRGEIWARAMFQRQVDGQTETSYYRWSPNNNSMEITTREVFIEGWDESIEDWDAGFDDIPDLSIS